ncbi:MAG: hypothetical protein WAM28_06920 [Chlamydiales bacterium]
MLKKIILSVFLFPLVTFSALYAAASYPEEYIKLTLPEEERDLWAREVLETGEASEVLWVHLESNEEEGSTILLVTLKDEDEGYDEIINPTDDAAFKLLVWFNIAPYDGFPVDDMKLSIFRIAATEVLVVGEHQQGVTMVRMVSTQCATHMLVFNSWGKECDQDKWIEILKNATIEKSNRHNEKFGEESRCFNADRYLKLAY